MRRKERPTVHSLLGELYLPLEGLVDVAAEKTRLTKELARGGNRESAAETE